MNEAFSICDQILIEEYIFGRELVIGVYRHNGKAVVLPITAVNRGSEFHSHAMKTQSVAWKRTPADLPDSVTKHIQSMAGQIYDQLNCRGPMRYDLIWQEKEEKLFFLELNDPPYIDETSSFVQEVWASGRTFRGVFTEILEEATFKHEDLETNGIINGYCRKINGKEKCKAKIDVIARPTVSKDEGFDFVNTPSIKVISVCRNLGF